jgi:ribosomal protein S27AE
MGMRTCEDCTEARGEPVILARHGEMLQIRVLCPKCQQAYWWANYTIRRGDGPFMETYAFFKRIIRKHKNSKVILIG